MSKENEELIIHVRKGGNFTIINGENPGKVIYKELIDILRPYKYDCLTLKAKRVNGADCEDPYIFTYKGDKTIRIAVKGTFSVNVLPKQIGKWLVPFRIVESDHRCGPGGTMFPVLFEVIEIIANPKESAD